MSKRSSTLPNKVYKFVHTIDESITLTIIGKKFRSQEGFIELTEDGTLFINGSCLAGYAWDGCTPKWEFLDFIFGTPDGRLDILTEKPMTYYASMIHDAIYQYKSQIPISRKDADIIFLLILKESGFRWSWLYYFLVRMFGWLYGTWNTTKNTRHIRIIESSWIIRAYYESIQIGIKEHPFLKIASKIKNQN